MGKAEEEGRRWKKAEEKGKRRAEKDRRRGKAGEGPRGGKKRRKRGKRRAENQWGKVLMQQGQEKVTQ